MTNAQAIAEMMKVWTQIEDHLRENFPKMDNDRLYKLTREEMDRAMDCIEIRKSIR